MTSIDNVTELTPRVQYVAAVSQTAFTYPFPIFADTDLVVDVDGTVKTLTTHYTVSGAGADLGGTITFGVALTGGEVVTIYRDIAIERTTDYQQNGPWTSTSVNDELDRLTLVDQQLQAGINRALRIPTTATVDAADIELTVANWANKYLTFDADGKPTPAALSSATMTQATIGVLLSPQTQAEIDAVLTPVDYSIPSHAAAGIVHTSRYLSAAERAGTTECSSKLQTIANMCRDNKLVLVCAPADRYKTATTITFTFPGQVRMNGARIVPDTASFTGTEAVKVDSLAYATARGDGLRMDIAVQGPNGGESVSKPAQVAKASYNTLDGIVINPTNQVNDVDLKLWCEGFRDGIVVKGSNWWLIRFQQPNNGKHWRYGWNLSRVSNAGEMIGVHGGVTYNCVNAGTDGASAGDAIGFYEDGSTNLDIAFFGHSIDYCNVHADIASGKWNFYGCHSENNTATAQFRVRKTVSKPATLLNFWGEVPSPGSGTTGYDSAEAAGGRAAMIETYGAVLVNAIAAEVEYFGYYNTALVKSISGSAPHVRVMAGAYDLSEAQAQAQMVPYAGNNLLYNGDFETGNINGWTDNGSSGSTHTVASDAPITGTYSFKNVSTGGNSSSYYQDIPCKSDDLIVVQADCKITSYTGGQGRLRVVFYAADGTTSASDDQTTCGSLASATTLHLGGRFYAPKGATKVRLHLFWNAFTGTGYFDNAELYNLG